MKKTVTRRVWWSEAEWRAYIAELCRARLMLFEFAKKFPATAGLRAADLFWFGKAHGHLEFAAVALESVVAQHLGGKAGVPGGWIDFVRGRQNGKPLDPSDCFCRRGPW